MPSADSSDFPFEYTTGAAIRKLYATDASEYQEMPHAVAFPERPEHIRQLIQYARENGLSLIPRAAGTSLAGQVVGSGIVVDAGRRMHGILDINPEAERVRVQPGVVRDELNQQLKQHGLFFGPETSTANRAMMGGMVGNNSCGSNSIVYGSVRDHLVACKGFLSDGSAVEFRAVTVAEFNEKCEQPDLEGQIYSCCREMLGDPANRRLITDSFPKSTIPRRNTGYALDLLMDAEVFDPRSDKPFNLCKLIAGSEGTLFFGTEFTLHCDPLPPPHSALLCAHFDTVDQALRSVITALAHGPSAVELIDHHVLEATKRNRGQAKNRFFVKGDPGAILVIDIRREQASEVDTTIDRLVAEIKALGYGTHFPVLKGEEESRVWELRKAGQGLVSNVPGDKKPREVCEDTAVDVAELADYIAEFDALMREKYGMECVYYAHAGSGELHTRPMFNLKTEEGLKRFRSVAQDIAALVKKYRGSLSGEHGDGRLRGEFIPYMVGDACFQLMRQIKEAFDRGNIFNPGKIIDTPPMDTSLRFGPAVPKPEYDTLFDFTSTQGILRAAENCYGSGDCRKGHLAGGTMCPSYMATRQEKDSTRARANILRHVLTHPVDTKYPFDSAEAYEVLDLCLSCKACKSECPSNVDMAKLKAEFLQHYYDRNGVPLRSRLVANFTRTSELASHVPWLWNAVVGTPVLRQLLNRMVGFHPDRTLPGLSSPTVLKWHSRQRRKVEFRRKVYLFADEFTNYNDSHVGRRSIQLLNQLGYEVVIPEHHESARTWLSKGLVREAKRIANQNIRMLAEMISDETPLIGIEPSAILSFRDEYVDLADPELKEPASRLARNCLLLEEFVVREHEAGHIRSSSFTRNPQKILLHGHCFQKALASIEPTVQALQIPENYTVEVIPSGCCGMAGSFGYEKEHYDISMQIGELVLFPAVREAGEGTIVAASGTSCRHQIKDGTGHLARHPAEILFDALDPILE